MKKHLTLVLFSLVITSIYSSLAFADGMLIDKVYHPYVMPQEREFEWRVAASKRGSTNRLFHRLGYGHSLSERFTLEGYLIGERSPKDNDFTLAAYELEGRYMFNEQGELYADWGGLIELEYQEDTHAWESAVGLLFEKEFTETSLTLNLMLAYEGGGKEESEASVEFRGKYRYRWFAEFQPAIEWYTGDHVIAIGPAAMGIFRIKGQEQIKWEVGFITELSQEQDEHILRFSLEYEF